MRIQGRLLTFLGVWVLGVCGLGAQQRPAITGIAFVRMYASDGAASSAFYKSLGYREDPATAGTTQYAVGRTQWVEVVPLPSPAPDTRLAAVGLMTTDARAMERYLRAHAVEIKVPLQHGEFGVDDPEGHRVMFVQTGSKKLQPAAASAASHHIIHAGFVVADGGVEDHFYRELLGFRPYWHGGMKDGATDFVSLQVPDGSDWLEYMLNNPHPTPKQAGGMNHFSLGLEHMSDAVTALAASGCQGPNCSKTQMGRDGKVQMNVFDPDGTRVEYMEFRPSGPTCCSEYTAKHPDAAEAK